MLITNGGGVPDAERRAALSNELGVEVRASGAAAVHD
jgi:hypothetical protein